MDKKFEAFGFNVVKINGHCFDEIEAAFESVKKVKGKPSVIIASPTASGLFMASATLSHGPATL